MNKKFFREHAIAKIYYFLLSDSIYFVLNNQFQTNLKCKKPRDAERTLQLWRVPSMLIIHLKRFKSEGRWKSKIQTLVNYPLEGLDLREYVKGPRKQPPYKLIAVTNHQGASTDSGHYTAFCKRASNWIK